MNYYDQQKKKHDAMSKNMITKGFNTKTIEFMNAKTINEMIRDDTVTDSSKELYAAIKEEYIPIIEKIYNDDVFKAESIAIFTNHKFLSVLDKILKTENVTGMIKVYINKLIFDYIKDGQSQEIKDMMYRLSKSANKDILPILISIGLPEDIAISISIAKFSNVSEEMTIKRVNSIIIASDPAIMTDTMIIKIYNVLFTGLAKLFESIMFDVRDLSQMTEAGREIYGNISLAILVILETMPAEIIVPVLKIYSSDYFMNGKPAVRFSLNTIAACDYPRILQLKDMLYATEQVFIP